MAYKSSTIRQFKGLSQNIALTSEDPSFAIDCLNVIVSESGLAKLRVPTSLTPAVGTQGPDQFGEWEGGSSKSVLAFYGQDIYVITLDDFTPGIYDSNPAYAGPVPWSVVLSNETAFMQNGRSNPVKYKGGPTLDIWGIQGGLTPLMDTTTGGSGVNLANGRSYRVAYKSTATGHVGNASFPTVNTDALINFGVTLTIRPPVDGDRQVDAARIYTTLDGGADYFFLAEVP